jgi:hypothetical protein
MGELLKQIIVKWGVFKANGELVGFFLNFKK